MKDISVHGFTNSKKTNADISIAHGVPGDLKEVANVQVRIADGKIVIEVKRPQTDYKAAPRIVLETFALEELLQSLEGR